MSSSTKDDHSKIEKKGVFFFWFRNLIYIYIHFNPCPKIHSLILERGKGETGRSIERTINQLPPARAPAGDRTCNTGVCPDGID